MTDKYNLLRNKKPLDGPWDIWESIRGHGSHDAYWQNPGFLTEVEGLLKFDNDKNLGYNNTVKKEQKKESNDSMFDASNMMNKYFGKIQNGMVRLSMNGDMAIKTSNGYKTYDVKTGTLTNCDSFVFDIGSEFFFIIPTNKVETGDVILASGKPHCVIKAENNRIEALRYEDGSIVTIIPEHHVFMGKTYFYGKIVSMFGKIKGGKGMNGMMKYMMMSEMMKGNGGNNNSMSSMLPMMMLMNGGMGDMFEGMFDFDEEEDEKEEK
jgi:hypothetical protein